MSGRIPSAVRLASAVVMLAVVFPPAASRADTQPATSDLPADSPAKPRLALGLNVMQPAIYALASTFFEDSHYIPVPIEAHLSINKQWGLASTLGYFNHQDGDYKVQGLQLGLEWNGLWEMINYYLPIVNITVGFDI